MKTKRIICSNVKGGIGKSLIAKSTIDYLNSTESNKIIVAISKDKNNTLDLHYGNSESYTFSENNNKVYYYNLNPFFSLTKEEEENAIKREEYFLKRPLSEKEKELTLTKAKIFKKNNASVSEIQTLLEQNFAENFEYNEEGDLVILKTGEIADYEILDYEANHDDTFNPCDIFNVIHNTNSVTSFTNCISTLKNQLISRELTIKEYSYQDNASFDEYAESIPTIYQVIQNTNKSANIGRVNDLKVLKSAINELEKEFNVKINIIQFDYIPYAEFFSKNNISFFVNDEDLKEIKEELFSKKSMSANEFKAKSLVKSHSDILKQVVQL